MYLEVINRENLDLDDFCTYLCAKLSIYSQDEGWLDSQIVTLWNNYLNLIYANATKKPTVEEIFHSYFRNLVYLRDRNNYIIKVDKNAKIKGVDASIESLAKIINYGTLDCPKYDVFDKVFEFIALRLSSLYEEWSRE